VQDLKELVQLLRSDFAAVQANAATVVCNVSVNPDNCVSFAELGAIPLLVQLLRSDSTAVQENAAKAVCQLTYLDAANRVSFAKSGAILQLVKLLSTNAAFLSLTALSSISEVREARAVLATTKGALSSLELLSISDDKSIHKAALALLKQCKKSRWSF